jgi:hypothetical protein
LSFRHNSLENGVCDFFFHSKTTLIENKMNDTSYQSRDTQTYWKGEGSFLSGDAGLDLLGLVLRGVFGLLPSRLMARTAVEPERACLGCKGRISYRVQNKNASHSQVFFALLTFTGVFSGVASTPASGGEEPSWLYPILL